MFQKKGLSDIVSTVLIVLLALAAVGIVWGFVSPAIRNSGVSVQRNDLCLSSEVLPIKCEYEYDGTDYTLKNVIVKHSKGGAVTELKAVLTFDGDTSETQSLATTGLLSTLNFASTFVNADNKKPKALETAAVIATEDGELFDCPQISNKIDCEEVAGDGGTATFCGDGACDYPTETHAACPSDCNTWCGDNVQTDPNSEDGIEECDGGDFDGETCETLGYSGGTLRCTVNCLRDETGCYSCGGGGITECGGYLSQVICENDECNLFKPCFWNVDMCDDCDLITCSDYNNNEAKCTNVVTRCPGQCQWCAASTSCLNFGDNCAGGMG